MASSKNQRIPRTTLLVIVEGETEFAFCRFLKDTLSYGKNIEIQIKNAHGGSPDKILEYASRLAKHSSYDGVVIVFDTDRPLTAKGERTAQRIHAELFGFTPCIEGFFLRLLDHEVPSESDSCKRKFHEVGLNEIAKLSFSEYQKLFPKERFAEWIPNPQFARLVTLFSNQGGRE